MTHRWLWLSLSLGVLGLSIIQQQAQGSDRSCLVTLPLLVLDTQQQAAGRCKQKWWLFIWPGFSVHRLSRRVLVLFNTLNSSVME
jgi:hypothetical protein